MTAFSRSRRRLAGDRMPQQLAGFVHVGTARWGRIGKESGAKAE